MKKLFTKQLRSILMLAAIIILLAGILGGCMSKKDTDETIDKLSEISTDPSDTSEPTSEPTETTPQVTETDPSSDTVMGTVTTDNLNLRSNPSMDNSTIIRQLAAGTRVKIVERKTVDGEEWGRTSEGWIKLMFVALDGEDPVEPTDPEETTDPSDNTDNTATGTTGTITAEKLYIREGAGTSYDTVGSYKKGDTVQILETKNNWGRTDKGWISLKYVQTSGSTTNDTTNNTSNDNTTSSATGKTGTISTGALYIREGAGSSYDAVGKYQKGDKVEILETKNGWGRTDKGWISLKYVDLEGSTSTGSTGSTGSTSSEVVSDGKTTVLGNGVVTIGSLNVRSGPGTSYDKVDTVSAGERRAYYQASGSWVRIKEGWVSTKYFYIEGTTGEGAGTGTVTGNSVNLRTGPGTGFSSNGKVNSGDTVEILAQVTVGKTTWGYTKNGWISMDYVKMS